MQIRPIAIFIANILTASRILAGICIWFFPSDYHLHIILIALLTEFLDGQVARIFHGETNFGRLFDPIADKFFILSLLILLLYSGKLVWWHIPFIGARDFLVIYAMFYGLYHGAWSRIRKLKPRLSGKIATAVQFAYFVNLYVRVINNQWALIIAALTSVVAACDYYIIYKQKRI